MIEGSLKKELILNGSSSVGTFKENGIIYRIEPFSIIQEINIYDLEKDRNKIVRLSDRLTRDYEIVGITADIPEDDGDAQKKASDPGYQPSVELGVRIYSSQKAIENVKLKLTSYPFYTNKLFINHRDTWHIRANRKVDRITYKCKPIYLEQPIIFP